MNDVQNLIDRARKMCSPQTFYRLAKVTGIKHTSLTRVMLHDGALGNGGARKLALHMRLQAIDVITVMEIHRARTVKEKAEWRTERTRIANEKRE